MPNTVVSHARASRPTPSRTGARRFAAVTVLCALAGFGSLGGGISAMAADGDSGGGIGISVTVPSSTPTLTPSSTVPATSTTVNGNTTTTTPRGGTSSGTPSSSVPAVNTVSTDPLDDQVGLGGVVVISGLTSTNNPSINPLEGTLTTRFTVRNVSDDELDASAKFWITNVVGAKLSSRTVTVRDLAAGESRVVEATLPGVGQWTALTTHMTFTPPAEVDGTKLVPVTRDAVIFVEPWFAFAGLLLAAAGYGVVSLLQLTRGVRLARVTA